MILASSFLATDISFWARAGSSDPRPLMGVEGAPPRPSVGVHVSDTVPPLPRRVETPRLQERQGAPAPPQSLSSGRVETPRPQGKGGVPEPPQSGGVGDPITISDGSGGDQLSKDAHTVDEEVEASLVVTRMPWPRRGGRRKKKITSRSRGNSRRRSSHSCGGGGEPLEDELEQCRQQELLELQQQ